MRRLLQTLINHIHGPTRYFLAFFSVSGKYAEHYPSHLPLEQRYAPLNNEYARRNQMLAPVCLYTLDEIGAVSATSGSPHGHRCATASSPRGGAAELGGDGRRVRHGDHFAVLASACWTDRHSLSYQGAGPDWRAWAAYPAAGCPPRCSTAYRGSTCRAPAGPAARCRPGPRAWPAPLAGSSPGPAWSAAGRRADRSAAAGPCTRGPGTPGSARSRRSPPPAPRPGWSAGWSGERRGATSADWASAPRSAG